MRDDELSPDLRSLFDAERRRGADEIPPGAKDRVHAALAASLGAGIGVAAGGGAAAKTAAAAKAGSGALAVKAASTAAMSGATATAATATGGVVAKGLAIALVAAMAGTAGAGVYLAKRDADAANAKKPQVAAVAPHDDPAPHFDARALAPPPVEAPAATPPEKPAIVAPKIGKPKIEATPRVRDEKPAPIETPEEKATRLAGERTVLDAARAAIARNDGGAALIALEAHRDQYPDGALVEEREALTVLALAKLGRSDEADVKANRFRAKYPSSLFLGAVDEAVKPPSSSP